MNSTQTAAIFSSATDEWGTPTGVRDALYREYGLNFDPCPIDGNTNYLLDIWHGRAFVNPPYSDIRSWLDKALMEIRGKRVLSAVFLLPSRTGTSWWHEVVLPYAAEIRFIRGRLRFDGVKTNAPFDSVIVVFQSDDRRAIA